MKELIEEWREFNGYKVSNYGKVLNKHGKYLSTKPAKDGYVPTSIKDYNGKRLHGLHRIVATVFIPNPLNLPEVNHIDGNKENNRVDNLEWCTKSENQKHETEVLKQRNGEKHYLSFFTDEQIVEIYNLCKSGTMLYKDIAKLYGVKPPFISRLMTGERWIHLGLEPITLVRGTRRNGKGLNT